VWPVPGTGFGGGGAGCIRSGWRCWQSVLVIQFAPDQWHPEPGQVTSVVPLLFDTKESEMKQYPASRRELKSRVCRPHAGIDIGNHPAACLPPSVVLQASVASVALGCVASGACRI